MFDRFMRISFFVYWRRAAWSHTRNYVPFRIDLHGYSGSPYFDGRKSASVSGSFARRPASVQKSLSEANIQGARRFAYTIPRLFSPLYGCLSCSISSAHAQQLKAGPISHQSICHSSIVKYAPLPLSFQDGTDNAAFMHRALQSTKHCIHLEWLPTTASTYTAH